MNLGALDIIVFAAFYAVVLGVSMSKSRRERTGEDYFLASRGLVWPLIGFSLIAANISSEHFVGMAGQGAGVAGLAVASYEWMSAVTLVVVAFFFLPKFLRSGIFTIPEYLEYRYHPAARSIMAFYMMAIYVGVTISAVLYSGGVTLQTLFGDIHNPDHLLAGVVVLGVIAAAYTVWGGLKAAAWADLFQGSALLAGGVLSLVVGFKAIGVKEFFAGNADKLHMIMPADHPVLPWTALVVGLWIPCFYYWGLNQYITQKTLAAKTLRQGQLGTLFAAFLKLTIPFVIILPGLMSRQLYGHLMTGASGTDAAYPMLVRNLIGPGARAFIFAAISGAVISTLAAMLNSASTIFTMDLFRRLRRKDASERTLVRVGRLSTLAFVLIGCLIAPQLANPAFKGIFNYIQEFQGYISPGVLAAFIFGLLVKRAPAAAGITALLMTVPVYGFLQWRFGEVAFLNRMAITFLAIVAVQATITFVRPLREPRPMPVRRDFDLRPARSAVWMGALIVALTIALYIIFW
ncbi:MAG: sodium/solute symporter [Candidatus Aminicenantes bacterium]|nr:sodium/solute symporter [Candidatus Aminicenantes bacterium]